MLPAYMEDHFQETLSFQARDDDVWIIGFPKSGTNWLQEVVNLVGNGADLSSVQSPIEYRSPSLEFPIPGVKFIDKMLSPRCIKTHMPFSILPEDYHKKKPKTIFIARNPKDLVVSFHYFYNQFFAKQELQLPVTFDDFCQLFVDREVYFGPWWKHVKEGWKSRNDRHVLYITYENMKSDLPGSVRKIAVFLDKKLSDEDIEIIVSHCSFETMRKNTFVNKQWYKDCGLAHKDAHFFRKGRVGDWKNHLSKEIESKLDDIVATKLEPLGISFRDTSAERDK